MKAAQVIVPEGIVPDLSSPGKNQAIADLTAALATVRGVDTETALRDIASRERAGATLIPVGPYHVAIPHATSGACKQLLIAMGTSPEGIPWDPYGHRANLIVVLLGPPETHALYLRLLSRIAALCEIKGFLEQVLLCRSAGELIEKVADAEETLGEIPEAEGLPRFCIVGAGHGGMAMAGHLSLSGFQASLLSRRPDRISPVRARGGIDVTGEVEGFAPVKLATCDPAEALESADIVMIVVPATAHGQVAERLAPYLRDGQIVVLNPGRTGGALEFSQVIRRLAPSLHIYLGEAQTLVYACRVTNPGQVRIFSIKNSVPLATLPAYHISDILPLLRRALPQFVPGDNVIKTGLDNMGGVFHPAITVLNAGRIEDTHGDFEYYLHGVTK
ncbi:MAG: NAD/NADP octopine/nopaline dehydrogenase family protein, partial [Candidatus Krumholzibacteria bacterium]|nr:NAD/NADP octopine/nopaline dehydrogenase family protein [Candidatus Krumholzibacteria bacterium]